MMRRTNAIWQTVVATLLMVSAAGAQDNSLFHRSNQQNDAPTPERVFEDRQAGQVTDTAGNGSYVGSASYMQSDVPAGTRALEQHSLFAVVLPEPKTFKVHDLVTIIVRERKRSASEAKYKQDRDYELKARLAAWFRIHDKHWLQQAFQGGTPEVDFNWEEKSDNKGKHEREDLLELRITAEVVDVKPNDTLVLEATKEITTDDNVQVMRLTGTCRVEDISADNTVLSTQVAELAITIHNPGSVRDASKRGWIVRLLDVIRPF